MAPRVLALLAVLALTGAGCGSDEPAARATPRAATSVPAHGPKPAVRVPTGPAPTRLQVDDLRRGTGVAAQPGDTLSVNYVGVRFADGKEFDSSWDGKPIEFVLQAAQVIPGWDEGLAGMKVGGRRRLVIPARLAYGADGRPPAIPPNSPLVFVVDLLGVS